MRMISGLRIKLLIGGAVALAAAWGVAAGGIESTKTAFLDSFVNTTLRMGFTVQHIYVINRHETKSSDLNAALNINRGDPILTFDLGAAQERIEALGWVKSAVVERHLPDKLVVRLTERQPSAILQHSGRHELVDNSGAIIGPVDPKRFSDLKVITGENARFHTADLFTLLQTSPHLEQQVVGAAWVGNRRWTIYLINGMSIRLPENNSEKAWKRLITLVETRDLLDQAIETMDMRQPDRLIIRLRNGAHGKRRLTSKDA